jgi:prenyltransferase beta subunit
MRYSTAIGSGTSRRGRAVAATLPMAILLAIAAAGSVPASAATTSPSGTVSATPSGTVSSSASGTVSSSPSATASSGGTASGSATQSPAAKPNSTAKPNSAAKPNKAAITAHPVDLAAATNYLTEPANLIDGHYYEVFAGSGFADFGLTIDGALALAAAGNDPAALTRLVSFIDQRGKDASGRTVDDWSGIATPYASGGSLAKEALLAEVSGGDPASFGGHDLIAALEGTICAAASTGSDTSCAGAGNYGYANSVFAQALGVIAQLRAGDSAQVAGPLSYLQGLQQADGGWPSLLPSGPGAASDVDSTAIAVMALALAPGTSTAIAKGLHWLAGQQLADGGFPGAAGDSTNSAALAGQALRLDQASYAAEISKVAGFLGSQQNVDGGFSIGPAGPSGSDGSDIRASAQAVSGAVGTSFGTLRRDVHAITAAAAGARYLTGQLVDGNHLVSPFGPDYGLTADLALALAASGDQDGTLAKVVGYLRAHVADYADPAGTTSFPGPYSGAVGKLALLAEVTGQDPRAFGGFDLLATLTGHVCTAANQAGSCTAPGDFYQSFSTVSQSLAILALARGGVVPPAAALSRLSQLQCADGGFSSVLLGPGAACSSDSDTASYALQALTLVPGAGASVAAATGYLAGTQQADGGFSGAAGENSNSTGLAAQGLLGSGAPDQAGAVASAQAFLLRLQNADGGFGIRASLPASDVRSTTQAVPALVGATLTALLDRIVPVPPAPPSSAPPPSRTLSSTVTGSPAAGPASSINAGSTSRPGSLAATGPSTSGPLWLAALLLLAGAAMLALSRLPRLSRRRH